MTACPNIQDLLSNFYQNCDPSFLREPMPFWDFLWSDANTSGMQQMIVPGDAKVRTVVVTYEQRLLESEASEVASCDLNCTATKKRGDLSTSYTIDPCDAVEASELMAAKDFIYACNNNPDIVAKKIQRLIDVVIRKLNTRLVTRANALLGKWASDTYGTVSGSYLQVKTKKDSSVDPMPQTWQTVNFAMQQSMFCDAPAMIFGGAEFYNYANLMQSGCCTTSGLDIADISGKYGVAVAYDKRVNKTIGNNKAWVMQAGSLIPLYFTLNNNMVAETAASVLGLTVGGGGNYAKGVIADPRTQFPLDILISDNCGNLSIIVRGNATVKSKPSDLFAPGDEYEGVTGFAGIQVVNV